MRVFVTGATGFVMGAVARALRARGDSVTALVRDPSRASSLVAIGCDLVAGDVVDPTEAIPALRRADALVHGAAIYEIGVTAERRRAMEETNVTGTRRILIPSAIARLAGRLIPSMREVVSSADGVTFWASDAKARAELGTRPRDLETGMRDTFGSAARGERA